MLDVLTTDVLVIGGGAAGTNAALKAADLGVEVVMVVKGLLGKSGCSVFASHLPYYDATTEQKRADRYRYAVRYYNHYLTDQEHVRRMGQYMRTEFFEELERLGFYVRRDDDGALLPSSNRVPVAAAYKQGATGIVLMNSRRRAVLRLGLPVHEECAATSLLVDQGRVVGATVLDYRRGRLFTVLAKSTVLATGHADSLATRSSATREQSADGLAMAIRAGAEVANLESCWWHVSDMRAPRAWMRMHLYPNPLLGTDQSSRLYNNIGEMFYEQISHSPGSSAPYVEQIRRLCLEVEAGRANWDGNYVSGYDHIPSETILTFQHQAKVWKKLGLDVAKDRLECGITWHMRQGGIDLDAETMQTRLPGLYVAGGLGCHYLGGVGPVSYDGKVAGTNAAQTAHLASAPVLPEAVVAAEEARLLGYLCADANGPRPIQVKTKIRAIMWELGYVKNEAKLEAARDALRELRQRELSSMRLESTSRNWNTGWLDALDVASMLDACEAICRSGLLRKESRGAFYREDYPFIDNDNWLCKVILSRVGEDNWRVRYEPYATPHLKPDKGREPFFEADY